MRFHIHSLTAKTNALCFQPEPLLQRVFAVKLDFAAKAEHTLPGDADGVVQNTRNQACAAWQSCRPPHRAVGRNFSFRDFPDGSANPRMRSRCCFLFSLASQACLRRRAFAK